MSRAPVESSSVASVGFSSAHNRLEIEFRNGLSYQYFGVPRALYEQLLAATSKGAFVSGLIRGRFPYKRIETSDSEELTQ